VFQVGSLFNKANYAIGMPIEYSDMNEVLSLSVLRLRENGAIDNLYQTWWFTGACSDPTQTSLSSNQLDVSDLLGAFAMVALISGLGFIVIVVEILFHGWYHKTRIGHHLFNSGIDRCGKRVDKFLGKETTEDEMMDKIDQILRIVSGGRESPGRDRSISLDSERTPVSY